MSRSSPLSFLRMISLHFLIYHRQYSGRIVAATFAYLLLGIRSKEDGFEGLHHAVGEALRPQGPQCCESSADFGLTEQRSSAIAQTEL